MRTRRSDELLLVAAREPQPGATKTRLGESIGMERAAALYRAFLVDLANQLVPHHAMDGSYDFGWAYTPAGVDFRGLMNQLCPAGARDDVILVPQDGDGWAERQTNLLKWGHLHGYRRTILIASDSPQLQRSVIDSAFTALRSHDVVIGCVHDGGYYLIGVRGFHDVLSGVPMSTTSAADALAARAVSLGLLIAEVPATFDIDVEADLDLLIAELMPFGAPAPWTWEALQRLGLVVPTPDTDEVLDVAAHSS